jgi:hypothetical protein
MVLKLWVEVSLIRVTNGKFVLGFSRNLSTCFITFTEFWTIYRGLQLAKNRGSPKIWIESDSLSAINLIEGGCPISYSCHGLVVNDIKKIAAQVTSIKLSHILLTHSNMPKTILQIWKKLTLNNITKNRHKT